MSTPTTTEKTYRALRHDVVRQKQRENCSTVHHPDEKIDQVRRVLLELAGWGDLSTLELFAGSGNLTRIYADYGEVYANEKNRARFAELRANTADLMLVRCNNVDSFLDFHSLIALRQRFDVIDLDPYGFPSRFLPDIFLLIDDGVIFVTMPKPYVNILNGITAVHLTSYYGSRNPSRDEIIAKFVSLGLCHWRHLELLDCLDLKSVWRLAFRVKKVKATEFTGVRNR